MKQTRLIMGMPITIDVVDEAVTQGDLDKVFSLFRQIDKRYSPYNKDSEVSIINAGLAPDKWSAEMKHVLKLCQQTKHLTDGYFDINRDGKIDPSGIVKGWAIGKASEILIELGYTNFYINAGGDIQTSGSNSKGQPWRIGIRNPFNRHQNVKVVDIASQAVATSGTYERGRHIYDSSKNPVFSEIVSITVIGPNIFDADRFATAAFAMGAKGINFLEALPGHEAYAISKNQTATMTSGFEQYVALV